MNMVINMVHATIKGVCMGFVGIMAGIATYLFGHDLFFIHILLNIMLLDIFTGILKNGIRGIEEDNNLKAFFKYVFSNTLTVGAIRKLGVLVGVSACHFFMLGIGIDPIGSGLVVAFIVGETLSIFENLSDMGILVPESFRKYIKTRVLICQ